MDRHQVALGHPTRDLPIRQPHRSGLAPRDDSVLPPEECVDVVAHPIVCGWEAPNRNLDELCTPGVHNPSRNGESGRSVTPVSDELMARVRAWMAEDPDPETRAELQALVDADDEAALAERF